MRLAITFLIVVILGSTTVVPAQEKDPQYYHFLMQNCPGKILAVTLNDGQKVSGRCEAQLIDRVQISRKGVTYDIPYTDIAKMKSKRSWFDKSFGKMKEIATASYFCIYLVGAMIFSKEKEPW